MRILLTGICGFVGSTLVRELRAGAPADSLEIVGIDNLSRNGSWTNRAGLEALGVRLIHGDIRNASDLESVGPVDWVIDAAAIPSVLAGVDGQTSSRQLVEHNLFGTVNLLEFCKARKSGLILLSTSRVYSLGALAGIPVDVCDQAFQPTAGAARVAGFSATGIGEQFATTAPVSLYGATKLASEHLAIDYGAAFGFPVWINRCGVLAGAGQFGRADQGIFSYWIHAWRARRQLKYIGFGGLGYQVRDCLHPRDLVPLLRRQMAEADRQVTPVINLGGGVANSMSLAQLSHWCGQRWGQREIVSEKEPRRFDAPWVVMDSAAAQALWNWRVATPLSSVLEEIAAHAETHPDWLDISA